MSVPRHQRGQLYGTGDFTAALAAREAALGLGASEPDFADVAEATGLDVADVADVAETETADAPTADADETRLPPGVTILSAQRLNGAYVIRHWLNNRTVYVCGAPEAHVRAGMWLRDRRMEGNGQGYLCCACFTIEAGLYGIFERERR